jgi:vacuolar-type H+-ATPase subunit I/STV1
MVGESGTSKTGKLHLYYKCTNRKRHKNCTKKIEKKANIEQVVVQYIVDKVLTDENIEKISTKAMELIEKEYADTSFLEGLKAQLKETQSKINNLIKAIEMGIITETTKERLEGLEAERKDIEANIAREEIKKPLLSKERIAYWLYSFKNGDITNPDYQRRLVDTLLNSVYVYDNPDGTYKLLMTFNISGQNTATITSSDIACSAPLEGANPNTLFFIKHTFGFVL